MLNEHEVTGRARTHITQFDSPRFAAMRDAGEAFLAMRRAAAADGFDLQPFSSFRDYRMQLRIWNHKFTGRKPLYDRAGQERDHAALTAEQIVDAILNWSALPGGSRHQWGTEIDVVDGASMPDGYEPRLLPEEVAPGGLFAPLHAWLDENIGRFGFFRPYKHDRGGMYPEPWHLSYAPLSQQAIADLSIDLLTRITAEADIFGKEIVLERIPAIFHGHILNIVGPDDQ